MITLSHYLNISKRAILETFSLFGWMDVLVFIGCFLVFASLYFLACIFLQARFFIPQILKFFAFIVLLASPVFLFWLGQNILYKNEVNYKIAKRLEYSPTYFVDGVVTNVGRRDIGHCYLIVEGLRDPVKMKNVIANAILPLRTYRYRISGQIPRGSSVNFREVINEFSDTFYRESIECYGGK